MNRCGVDPFIFSLVEEPPLAAACGPAIAFAADPLRSKRSLETHCSSTACFRRCCSLKGDTGWQIIETYTK